METKTRLTPEKEVKTNRITPKKLTYTDPFNRLLIVQAKSNKLVMATTDAKFKYYSELKIIDISK